MKFFEDYKKFFLSLIFILVIICLFSQTCFASDCVNGTDDCSQFTQTDLSVNPTSEVNHLASSQNGEISQENQRNVTIFVVCVYVCLCACIYIFLFLLLKTTPW